MIFVTVGGQLPFDRLIHAVDAWARDHGRTDVMAQVGDSVAPPHSIRWARFLTPQEFDTFLSEAEVVISHAGIGTIMKAISHSVPLVVMARRADLGEHRNDHQMATARRFGSSGMVHVASDEAGLRVLLQDLSSITPPGAMLEEPKELIQALKVFVDGAESRLQTDRFWRIKRRPMPTPE